MPEAMAMIGLWLVAGLLSTPEAAPQFETGLIADVMKAEGLSVEPSPEGKRVAFVRIVRHEVFSESEYLLNWANTFHWLTTEETIRLELLFEPGDDYEPERVEETARNLRDLPILAVARVVPVRAADTPDDEVGILVYTRDLWSLRLEQNFQITGTQIDFFLLQLTERNLLGMNKRASISFLLRPLEFAIGQRYLDRRVFNQPLSLTERFEVVFNREDGAAEGARGAIFLGRPFFDLRQRWGWELNTSLDLTVARDVSQGEVLTWDDPDTDETEAIDRVYDRQVFGVDGAARLQLGEGIVHRFAAGGFFANADYGITADAGVPDENRASFEREVLPRGRTSVGPLLRYNAFEASYHRQHDLDAFAVSEDIRTGPSWSAAVLAPLEVLGSSEDRVILEAGVGYDLDIRDGVLSLATAGSTTREGGAWVDQQLATELIGATPRLLGAGRLVLRADWTGRLEGTGRTLVTLGGANGLRGYAADEFFAVDGSRYRTNLELRTVPAEIGAVHLGGLLFYDTGAVWERVEDALVHQSVGVGTRIFIPQLNAFAFRADAGFPLEGGFAILLHAGSGQVVPLTPRQVAQQAFEADQRQ